MDNMCWLGHLDHRLRYLISYNQLLRFQLMTIKVLLTLLHERSPNSLQIFFPLISGLGLGMLFHAPYQVFTAALKPHELATGTSAFFLVRFTGATTGLVGLSFYLHRPLTYVRRLLQVLFSTDIYCSIYPQTIRHSRQTLQSI